MLDVDDEYGDGKCWMLTMNTVIEVLDVEDETGDGKCWMLTMNTVTESAGC